MVATSAVLLKQKLQVENIALIPLKHTQCDYMCSSTKISKAILIY